MEAEQKQSKKPEIAIATLLIVITIIAVAYLNFYHVPAVQKEIDNDGPGLTTSYQNLSVEEAYNIKNNTEDILIVEISSCQCKWKSNCIDPSALWTVNPNDLVNETRDILVYSYSGDDCIEFCEALLNNTYGEIYYIEGGTVAWKQCGYPTYNCNV